MNRRTIDELWPDARMASARVSRRRTALRRARSGAPQGVLAQTRCVRDSRSRHVATVAPTEDEGWVDGSRDAA